MKKDSAISAVIGEILLIALVLILVPAVTINLLNQVPEDRTPTVNILMKVTPDSGKPQNIILYHKGGDYIKKDDISLIIRIRSSDGKVTESPIYHKDDLIFSSSSQVFDLGDYVTTKKSDEFPTLEANSVISISLVVKNAVIFTGEKSYEG